MRIAAGLFCIFAMMKRYNSYVEHLKAVYGCRLQKIVIDAGFSCPNRDGHVSFGGCTFCDNRAFHPGYSTPDKSILAQIGEGIEFHRGRYRGVSRYLAYFQPYSNTYAPLERLRKVYEEALSHPLIDGLVIGTRPDCVDDAVLDYIASLSCKYIVSLEFGIESCNDATLRRINRGHSWAQAEDAVRRAAERGISVGAHFIIGLPGDSREGMIEDAAKINSLPLTSIKFHQLQIIKGTPMERDAAVHPEDYVTFSLPEYIDLFIDILERLRPDLCIERFAGEVPPRFVNSTPWGLIRNAEMLRLLDRRLEERSTFQGRLL